MRRLWSTAVCLSLGAMLAIGAVPAQAQNYPNKTVRIVVPYGPGGGVSLLAQQVGTQDAGADEAAGRDRQPARRRRQPRRRPGREIAARWLHAADALERDGERLVALRQAAVRSGEGLRPGDHGDLDAVRDRRLAEKSGDESQGAGRARQGKARRLQLRFERPRLLAAPVRRDVQQHRRHQARAHPLSRRRADDHRADLERHPARLPAAGQRHRATCRAISFAGLASPAPSGWRRSPTCRPRWSRASRASRSEAGCRCSRPPARRPMW